jgi:hypothetical protein
MPVHEASVVRVSKLPECDGLPDRSGIDDYLASPERLRMLQDRAQINTLGFEVLHRRVDIVDRYREDVVRPVSQRIVSPRVDAFGWRQELDPGLTEAHEDVLSPLAGITLRDRPQAVCRL